MARRCPVSLELPDGSRFDGDAPIRSNAKYSPQFVLMGWLRPPERTLEEIVTQLIRERDEHEADSAPWVSRLERALETERFNLLLGLRAQAVLVSSGDTRRCVKG